MSFNPSTDLPATYKQNCLYMMVVDPQTLYVYWDISERKRSAVVRHYGVCWSVMPKIIRLYRASGYGANSFPAQMSYKDYTVGEAISWYFRELVPGETYIADFGILNSHGQFIPLIRSNPVCTPLDSILPPDRSDVSESAISHQSLSKECSITPEQTSPYEQFSTYTIYYAREGVHA